MAEVLGPLGICLGGLSFILSTVPAAARFAHNYSESKEQIRECESRFRLCQAKYTTWEKHWRSELDAQGGYDRLITEEVKVLESIIDRAIQDNTRMGAERGAWQQMKARLSCGIFRLPQANTHNFCDKLRHALWHKELLDGWIRRLEEVIAVTEKLFQEDYNQQTARHYTTTVTPKQSDELRQLNQYFGKLKILATDMYTECMATCKDGTQAWALGLRPPRPGIAISDWKTPTPVSIETRFSIKHRSSSSAYFHLKTCYEPDNRRSHTIQGTIQRLIRAEAFGISSGPCGGSTGSAECHGQHESSRRTISLGSMLKDKPALIQGLPWQIDRPELVYGISEWALLMWDTPWFEHLCCYGLALEIDACPADCAKQMLLQQPQDGCQCLNHTSRLRNLGLVLAQLILGVPIRLAEGDDLSKFEQWTTEGWETVYLSRLNLNILDLTESLLVQDAIYFCLQPKRELPTGDFRMGYLYMCIDRIFKP